MSETTVESPMTNLFSERSWKPVVTHRNRGRMKVSFKLSKDESSAFQAFQKDVRPEEISEENFIKSIFFLGLSTLEQNLSQRIAESMTVEDGEVSLEVPEEVSDDSENAE